MRAGGCRVAAIRYQIERFLGRVGEDDDGSAGGECGGGADEEANPSTPFKITDGALSLLRNVSDNSSLAVLSFW